MHDGRAAERGRADICRVLAAGRLVRELFEIGALCVFGDRSIDIEGEREGGAAVFAGDARCGAGTDAVQK